MSADDKQLTRRRIVKTAAQSAVAFSLCGCRSMGPQSARQQETDMLSPCGLICTDCPIYKAAQDSAFAEQLAQAWRQDGNQDARADWFKCRTCHGPKDVCWTEDCAIRTCCVDRHHLDDCSACPQFPCDKITQFETDGHPHHQAAVARLRKKARQDG